MFDRDPEAAIAALEGSRKPAPIAATGAGPVRSQRGIRTVVSVLALAALVAVASNGTSAWAPVYGGVADRGETVAVVALIFALGLAGLVAVTSALHHRDIGRGAEAGRWGATLWRSLPAATLALVLTSLFAITTMVDVRPGPDAGDAAARVAESSRQRGELLEIIGWWDAPVKAGEGEPAEGGAGAGGEPGRLLPILVLLAAATAALAGVAWWYRRRTRRRREEGAGGGAVQDAARGTVLGTIDAMLADPDPNTAIIGAYARLLEGLAACGIPRRDFEGPVEHLHRVLTVLHVRPEPLRRLVELFEVARFSTHALTPWHRERALDALREVAGDLARADGLSPAEAASRPLESRA